MAKVINREEFYSKVNATKNALVCDWKKDGCFKDKNNLTKSGVIPEGIGLTSLLLMLVAFGKDDHVFPAQGASDDAAFNAGQEDFTQIINTSFQKIIEWTQSGFNASPILNKKNAAIFDETRGYTETVTWCLSSAVLALYACENDALVLEENVRRGVLELLCKSFKALMDAQRTDGTWGFTTDGLGKRSLYFTYIANAALADFFDYVMDEISLVEDETVTPTPLAEIVQFMDNYLGIDTVAAAEAAREKLDAFLIETCLPMLPKIAKCTKMSEEELDALGATRVSPYVVERGVKEYYYHNLYYTYYILDMMVTASADKYFDRIAQDEITRKKLLETYASYVEKQELRYYSSPERFAEIFTSFYEQALHSSRMNYLSAARTGDTFWDKTNSELPILWEHEDEEIHRLADSALDQSKATLTDPTILPMSLRANVVYSFYVTNQPEITIERLFNDICENVYIGDEEDDEENDECVKDLWDSSYYNLMITERSIEAIVDYYDYLNKFQREQNLTALPAASASAAVMTAAPVPQKSPLDKALENAIADYLRSTEGQELIRAAVADSLPTVSAEPYTATTDIDMQSVIKFVSLLNKKNRTKHNPEGDDFDCLMVALEALMSRLQQCSIHKTLKNGLNGENQDEIEDKATRAMRSIFDQYKDLLVMMANNENLDDEDNKLAFLYGVLKDMKN